MSHSDFDQFIITFGALNSDVRAARQRRGRSSKRNSFRLLLLALSVIAFVIC